MTGEKFLQTFNEKLKNYEIYGHCEDNDENLYAHSDILQALIDVFDEIAKE